MLQKTKEDVLKANKCLPKEHLAVLTWGNVSALDRESGLIVIKASGVEYKHMTVDDLVVVDIDGNIVEGHYRPSTDLATHLELYRNFPNIGGVIHTHSPFATIWAQMGKDIPCYGTTHADYFKGDIPCTRQMTDEEIQSDYEKGTGEVIIDTLKPLDPDSMHAVLVRCHGPFVWGNDAFDTLHNAIVLENIAKMAWYTNIGLDGGKPLINDTLLNKHYNRKFGADAYYGQK